MTRSYPLAGFGRAPSLNFLLCAKLYAHDIYQRRWFLSPQVGSDIAAE